MPIKKEIQQFAIASEELCRLLSSGELLSCHEAEILNCCTDELSKQRRKTAAKAAYSLARLTGSFTSE